MSLHTSFTTPQLNSHETGKLFAKLSRPQNAVYSGVLAMACYLAGGGQIVSLRSLCLFALFIFLYALAATYNNLHDIHEDRLNARTDNPLLAQPIPIKHIYVFGVCMLAGASMCAAVLAQPVTIWVILFALCIIFAYSDPRIRLKSKGLAGIACLGIFYSVLPMTVGYLQLQNVSPTFLTAVFAVYCLSIGGLLAKDYKDEYGDRKSDIKTVLVQHGKQAVRIVAFSFLLIGYLAQLYITATHTVASWSLCFATIYCLIMITYHLREGGMPHVLLRLSHVCLIILAYINLA